MPEKINCWEFKRCGREPGGKEIARLGPCPAATANSYNDLNSGKNGGRICWTVTDTVCDGELRGTFDKKCFNCNFFYLVANEEGERFSLLQPDQAHKNNANQ